METGAQLMEGAGGSGMPTISVDVIAKTLTPREQVDLVRELAKRIAAESGTSIEAWRGNDHERSFDHAVDALIVAKSATKSALNGMSTAKAADLAESLSSALEAITTLDPENEVRRAIITAESSVSQRFDLSGSDVGESAEQKDYLETQKCLFGYMKHSTRLVFVDISNMRLGAEAAGWVAEAMSTNTRLKSVNVLGNEWGEEGTQAIVDVYFRAGHVSSLCGLVPGGNMLDLSSMGSFSSTDERLLSAELASNTSIMTLDVAGLSLPSTALASLAQATRSNLGSQLCYYRSDKWALREGQDELNLAGRGLHEGDGMMLGALLRRNNTLTRLNLLHNEFGVRGGQAIVQAIEKRMCPYPLEWAEGENAFDEHNWKKVALVAARAAAAATCAALWAYVSMRKARRIVRDAKRGSLGTKTYKAGRNSMRKSGAMRRSTVKGTNRLSDPRMSGAGLLNSVAGGTPLSPGSPTLAEKTESELDSPLNRRLSGPMLQKKSRRTDRRKGGNRRDSSGKAVAAVQSKSRSGAAEGGETSLSDMFHFTFSSSMITSVTVKKLYPAVYSICGLLPECRAVQLQLSDTARQRAGKRRPKQQGAEGLEAHDGGLQGAAAGEAAAAGAGRGSGQKRQGQGGRECLALGGSVADALFLAAEVRKSVVLKSLWITGHAVTSAGHKQREIGYLEEGDSSVKWRCLEVRWQDIVQTDESKEGESDDEDESGAPVRRARGTLVDEKREAGSVTRDFGWCAPVQGILPWNPETRVYDYAGVMALADAVRCNRTLERLRIERSALGGKHGERAVKALARALLQVEVGLDGEDNVLYDEIEERLGDLAFERNRAEQEAENDGFSYGGVVQDASHCGAALVELGLGGNGLDHQSVAILAYMLARNTSLHALDISQNSGIGRSCCSVDLPGAEELHWPDFDFSQYKNPPPSAERDDDDDDDEESGGAGAGTRARKGKGKGKGREAGAGADGDESGDAADDQEGGEVEAEGEGEDAGEGEGAEEGGSRGATAAESDAGADDSASAGLFAAFNSIASTFTGTNNAENEEEVATATVTAEAVASHAARSATAKSLLSLFEALSRPSTSQRLTSLNLAYCSIGDDGVHAMLEGCSASGSDLTHLDLSHNRIHIEGAAMLSRALKGAGRLPAASLRRRSSLGSVGGQSGFAPSTESMRCRALGSTLLDLNVSNNKIGVDGAKQLCEAVHSNQQLTSLNLSRTCSRIRKDSQNRGAKLGVDDDGPASRNGHGPGSKSLAKLDLPPPAIALAVRQIFQRNPVIHRVYII